MLDAEAVFRLLTALCEVARRDARRGNLAARQWLAELEAARPRKVRILRG